MLAKKVSNLQIPLCAGKSLSNLRRSVASKFMYRWEGVLSEQERGVLSEEKFKQVNLC